MSDSTVLTLPPGRESSFNFWLDGRIALVVAMDAEGTCTVTMPKEEKALTPTESVPEEEGAEALHLVAESAGRCIHGTSNAGEGRTVMLLGGHSALTDADGAFSTMLPEEEDHRDGQRFRAYVTRSSRDGGGECYAEEIAYRVAPEEASA